MRGETLSIPNREDGLIRETLPSELLVEPWVDELVETHGFGPRSMYVETCWLPVLGPTTTLLYRRLGSWAEYNPDGVSVDLTDLAVSLGLGEGLSRSSHLARALDRLVGYHAGRWTNQGLQVRRALAPLSQRHLERLSYSARRMHEEITRRPPKSIGPQS